MYNTFILVDHRHCLLSAEMQERVRRVTLERIGRATTGVSVMVFFPQIVKEPNDEVKKRHCEAGYLLLAQYDEIGMTITDQLDVQITPENISDVSLLTRE